MRPTGAGKIVFLPLLDPMTAAVACQAGTVITPDTIRTNQRLAHVAAGDRGLAPGARPPCHRRDRGQLRRRPVSGESATPVRVPALKGHSHAWRWRRQGRRPRQHETPRRTSLVPPAVVEPRSGRNHLRLTSRLRIPDLNVLLSEHARLYNSAHERVTMAEHEQPRTTGTSVDNADGEYRSGAVCAEARRRDSRRPGSSN